MPPGQVRAQIFPVFLQQEHPELVADEPRIRALLAHGHAPEADEELLAAQLVEMTGLPFSQLQRSYHSALVYNPLDPAHTATNLTDKLTFFAKGDPNQRSFQPTIDYWDDAAAMKPGMIRRINGR